MKASTPARPVALIALAVCAASVVRGQDPHESRDAERVRALVEQLKDTSPEVGLRAASALAKIGPPAVPA
ncbi:MAG: hypothetical protein ACYSU0_11475, partial [Planctomycetota bacterium]